MERSGVVDSMGVQLMEENAPALRAALLEWWEANGRHWIPWKLKPDGTRPSPEEPLCVLSTWVAEANRR